MKNFAIITVVLFLLTSCEKINNSDKFEGYWLLKKRHDKSYLVKLEKVNEELYVLHGGPTLGFGVLKNDTIYGTDSKRQTSIDKFYLNKENQLFFDGDSMIRFNEIQANKILLDKSK
jgi:hypothetical protein